MAENYQNEPLKWPNYAILDELVIFSCIPCIEIRCIDVFSSKTNSFGSGLLKDITFCICKLKFIVA